MMKFLVSFVMFFLLLNGFATSQTLIQDSCKKAAARNPSFNVASCVQSLESDPQSKAATSLEGLLVASTKNAASKNINVKGIAQRILNDKASSRGIESELRTCIELYDDAIDSFNEALTSAKSGDYGSVNVHLSAALDAPTTCEDGFKEDKQKKSPLANDNNVLYQKIVIPLAFSNIV